MRKIVYLLALAISFAGCSVDSIDSEENLKVADAKSNKSENDNGPIQLGEPSVICGEVTADDWMIKIKAGLHGAPAGFKIEWMTLKEFNDNSGWNEELLCGIKLEEALTENEETSINLADFIGEGEQECYMEWDCEEEYVFRAMASNPQGNEYRGSGWSGEVYCQAQICEVECLYGYGYWKNHGLSPNGNQEYSWPIDKETGTLLIGDQTLTVGQIYEVLISIPEKGDAITTLKHHLISAKFNTIMIGDDSAIADVIHTADEMIINEGDYSKEQINAVKDQLEAYNESAPCDEEED